MKAQINCVVVGVNGREKCVDVFETYAVNAGKPPQIEFLFLRNNWIVDFENCHIAMYFEIYFGANIRKGVYMVHA